MKKTRDLPQSFGGTEDLSYNGRTYVSDLDYAILNYIPEEKLWKVRLEATANYYRIPSTHVGFESLSSTSFPRPRVNECVHYKYQNCNKPLTQVRMLYYLGSTTCYVDRKYRFLNAYETFQSPPQPADWSLTVGSSRRAWWAMQPRFEGEVQMLNFLFELKDFKSLVKHALKTNYVEIAKSLLNVKQLLTRKGRAFNKHVADHASRGFKKNYTDTIADATRVASEMRLAYAFAIKPLQSDLMHIHAQLATLVGDVQKQFADKGLETNVTHFSEVINTDSTVLPGTKGNYWYGGGTFQRTLFTATMEYKYNYAMRDEMSALKRYYGLSFSPEVIWNAIPFSFLFDYFIKIGKSFHDMRKDPNVSLSMDQYYESILNTHNGGVMMTGDPRVHAAIIGDEYLTSPGLGTLISGTSGTTYTRKFCYPNKGSAIPRFKLPSTGQSWNIAALARCFL